MSDFDALAALMLNEVLTKVDEVFGPTATAEQRQEMFRFVGSLQNDYPEFFGGAPFVKEGK